VDGPKQVRTLVRVVPSWTEPMVASASALIGGPLGRHAVVGRSRFWTPLRVVLLLAVLTCALGWLLKAPCIQQYQAGDGKLALDWRNTRQYVALCYSDVITLWHDHRLDVGELPYLASWTDDAGAPDQALHYMDYPVLSGYLLWMLARIAAGYLALAGTSGTPGNPGFDWLPTGLPEAVFFNVVAGTLAVGWLVVVWTVHRQRRTRPWDAALVAVAPVAVFQVFTGVDVWAVALAAVGLCLLSRGKPVLAGVLIGLAGAAKVYPLLLLLPIVLVDRRRRTEQGGTEQGGTEQGGTPGVAGRVVVGALVAWVCVNLPVALVHTPGWLEFLRVGISRRDEPDSVWFAVSTFTGWPGFDGVLDPGETPFRLNLVVGFWTVLCCVGVALLSRWAPRTPRLASLSFLLIAGVLLVSKTPSPQFTLWLVPLAVLALPRWPLLLSWLTVEAALWAPRMYYYVGADAKGLSEEWFEAVVLIRDAVLILVMALVVLSVLRPDTDPVRAVGARAETDDPDWPAPAPPPRAPEPAELQAAEPVPAS
jgi:uncharacterized membrane protein